MKKISMTLLAGLLMAVMAAGALAQPSVHDVAGAAKLDGNPAPIGAVIVAKDSNGTERGSFIVATQGIYGFLHINGDDPESAGEAISFFINGVEAQQTLTWQSFASTTNFNLSACSLSTYSITVQTDKAEYNPGSSMLLSGYLLNSQCELEPGKTVAYHVPNTAIMGQIQTNSTGYFSDSLALPADMAEGGYTLWASYPPEANETVYNTVNFTISNDIDGDGYNYTQDCNDQNPSIHPGAAETCGNGIDEDCSGSDSTCPTITTTGGGGGGGGGCFPNWTCASWSGCQPNGTQSRICTDQYKCVVSIGKPSETQSCNYTAPTAEEGVCTTGAMVCTGNDLMECSLEGKWVKSKTCEFGCSGNACNQGPGASEEAENLTAGEGAPVAGMFLLEPSAWPYWIIIIIVIVLLVLYLIRRMKKKGK